MKPLFACAALSALAATGCMAGSEEPPPLSPQARADIDAALAGRTAGPPEQCVRQQELRGNRPIGENAILFEGRGDVVYLNRPSGTCDGLRPWSALRFRTVNTTLCAGELAVVFDPRTGMEYGGCSLGRFIPYRRADR